MGSDLTVVNAARVSFNKQHDRFTLASEFPPNGKGSDENLIKYLSKHNHWTPFSHVIIQMRETIPIFTARQRFKHMVGFTYNETSRRYDDSPPEFFLPNGWRKAAENVKQGSSLELVENSQYWDKQYEQHIENCQIMYDQMLQDGIAPEQARIVLPQSMYTSYYVTGSLAAWARAYKLRIDGHAQLEIQELAKQWDAVLKNIPELQHSWKALTNDKT